MKQLIYILSLLWLMVLGCEPIEDFNHNPNNVSETHPQYLLTNIPANATRQLRLPLEQTKLKLKVINLVHASDACLNTELVLP